MKISRILKIIIAIFIAVALTAGFLYVKLKKGKTSNVEVQQTVSSAGPEKLSEKQMLDSISAPSDSNSEVKPEILKSLTAPAGKKTAKK